MNKKSTPKQKRKKINSAKIKSPKINFPQKSKLKKNPVQKSNLKNPSTKNLNKKRLNKQSSELKPIDHLITAIFRVKTLEEASTVSGFIAEACPNPRLVQIGISELIINGIEHGNLGINYDEKTILQKQNTWLIEIEKRLKLPENKDKFVEIEFTRQDKTLKIKITDQGPGFDWKKHRSINTEGIYNVHGRGIPLVHSLAFDKLEYSEKGNEVTCIIHL